MLDRMKGLGGQISSRATEAVDGIASSVRGGVENLSGAATGAVAALSEKAIRTAIEQMRSVLAIAAEELRERPVAGAPATLTASVTLGVTSLEIQVVLPEPGAPVPPVSLPGEPSASPSPEPLLKPAP